MSEPYLGELMMIGFSFAPRGWTTCDGQQLPINQNQSLYSLLGTTFGGDGRTSFNLPDLRGVDPVHVGHSAGLPNITWGGKGGAFNETLVAANLPPHDHSVTPRVSTGDGDSTSPSNRFPAKSSDSPELYADSPTGTQAMATVTGATAGGSSSLMVKDPFLGIYHIIALTGQFPSRN